jgi:hypothetical protein
MSASRSYTGSCHCGAVRYHATADLSTPVIACNCSICSRAGWLLTFVPASDFTLERGDDHLTDYQFAAHHVHHVFCKVCGVRAFSHGPNPKTGSDTYAVNVRCLDDVDPTSLTVTNFDGRSR